MALFFYEKKMTNWIFNRQIKEIVGSDDPEYTGDDARISLVNKTVTATLENLLGRSLAKNEYTEFLDSKRNAIPYADVYGNSSSGYGSAYKQIKYYLKNFPINTEADFTVYYTANDIDDSNDPLTSDDYTLDAEKGILILNISTIEYPRGIKVVYTAGYDDGVDVSEGYEESDTEAERALSDSLPSDFVTAALYQAAHTYDKLKFSNINVRESRGQGSTNSSRYVNIHAIAPEALAIIAMRKRKLFTSV